MKKETGIKCRVTIYEDGRKIREAVINQNLFKKFIEYKRDIYPKSRAK